MNILEKYLNKLGLTSPDQLEPEEQKTYTEWQRILSKDELTLEDIKKFCLTQVSIIEAKWKDYNLDNEKKAQLIPYHTVYKTLGEVVEAPKQERERLEAQLTQAL